MKKTFTVVRIELGTIEAYSQTQAENLLETNGFHVNHSEEKVFDPEKFDKKSWDFWNNLGFDSISEIYRKVFFVNSKMNKYKAVLMHDDGRTTLTVYARNYQSAIQQIMNNEKCPESAIISLEIKTD